VRLSQPPSGPAAAADGAAAAAPDGAAAVEFVDITEQAGIRFRHDNGARGKKFMPETIGSGVAFLDYDNDGWQDLLFMNGEPWPGDPGPRDTLRLYRNNRDGPSATGRARPA
jgi:hypothetical protein